MTNKDQSTESLTALTPKALEIISKMINEYLFRFKDVISENPSLDCNSISKKGSIKIFCKNTINNETITLLCSIWFTDAIRLRSIVAGCLASIGIKSNFKNEIENDFANSLSKYLKHKNDILVCLEENTICLRHGTFYFAVCEMKEVPRSCQEFLLRSICLLMAMCNKNVRNNIDALMLNEYGVENIAGKTEDENVQDETLL